MLLKKKSPGLSAEAEEQLHLVASSGGFAGFWKAMEREPGLFEVVLPVLRWLEVCVVFRGQDEKGGRSKGCERGSSCKAKRLQLLGCALFSGAFTLGLWWAVGLSRLFLSTVLVLGVVTRLFESSQVRKLVRILWWSWVVIARYSYYFLVR